MNKSVIPVLIFVTCISLQQVALAQTVNISLDSTVKFQTMYGWEATDFIESQCDSAFPAVRDSLVNKVVNEIGINRIRLEIRSGVENSYDYYNEWINNGCPENPDTNAQRWRRNRYANVNDNNDTSINWNGFHFTELDWTINEIVIPMKKKVEANGEKLIINLCYVAFTGQITSGVYIQDNPDEYAEFVTATYLHMQRKFGFVPDVWEMVLEPDNVKQWNGKVMGQAMVKTADRLIKNGFSPAFVAPSTTNMANATIYFDSLLKVPNAIKYLKELSYHRYAGTSTATLKAIAARAKQHNINTAMLEWWFQNSTYAVLHEDLTTGMNSSFQQDVISEFFTTDKTDIKKPKVTIKYNSEFTRLYYQHIRTGAVRIVASSNDSSRCNAVAFINSNGNYSVVVKATSKADIQLNRLPPGTYGISYAVPSKLEGKLSDMTIKSGDTLKTSIPSYGVIAIYKKGITTTLTNANRLNTNRVFVEATSNATVVRLEKPLEATTDIQLFNALGQEVGTNVMASSQRWIIGNEVMKSGIYFFRIITNKGEAFNGKFLVR